MVLSMWGVCSQNTLVSAHISCLSWVSSWVSFSWCSRSRDLEGSVPLFSTLSGDHCSQHLTLSDSLSPFPVRSEPQTWGWCTFPLEHFLLHLLPLLDKTETLGQIGPHPASVCGLQDWLSSVKRNPASDESSQEHRRKKNEVEDVYVCHWADCCVHDSFILVSQQFSATKNPGR